MTAAMWDGYGPRATAHRRGLTYAFATHLGHSAATLTLYRAAYALSTRDLFSSNGSEGHLPWCARLLNQWATTERLT